jgi:hypothetical protein
VASSSITGGLTALSGDLDLGFLLMLSCPLGSMQPV